MANVEGGRFIEGAKTLNKISLAGALGVATYGAFFAPFLIAPALTWAAIDGVQIVGIKAYQWKKQSKE